MRFFEFASATAFSREWKQLNEQDKLDLVKGVKDGSLTY